MCLIIFFNFVFRVIGNSIIGGHFFAQYIAPFFLKSFQNIFLNLGILDAAIRLGCIACSISVSIISKVFDTSLQIFIALSELRNTIETPLSS